jgi:maltose O-acetyltransferase
MLKLFAMKMLSRLRREPDIERLKKAGLRVGQKCAILQGVIIDDSCAWLIHIGDEVTLAPRVHIMAHDASMRRHLGYTKIAKVRIGNKVFIGAGSIILPGICIGDNSIIGAGSVVSNNIPANVVAAGSPARILRSLDEYLVRHQKQMEISPCFGEEYTIRRNVSQEMKDEMNDKIGVGVGYVV